MARLIDPQVEAMAEEIMEEMEMTDDGINYYDGEPETIYTAEKKLALRKHSFNKNLKLWSSPDGTTYYPVSETCEKLPPDVYEFSVHPQQGPLFTRINYSIEDLIRFEDSTIDEVVEEIEKFWQRQHLFEEYKLPFRRGILMYGPAGSGKSCATKLIIHDVLKKGGIGVKFEHPGSFIECMRAFRQLQPDTEVIVIMEDIEASFRRNRTQILNLLDGIDSFEKVAYLATTNYPELLEPRIKNRPSRFDKRFNIGLPKAKARRQFIEHLLSKSERIKDLDVNRWEKDTEEMSFAHIKELFISVNLFGREYEDTLVTLREMTKNVTSENFGDNGRGAGFKMSPAYMR